MLLHPKPKYQKCHLTRDQFFNDSLPVNKATEFLYLLKWKGGLNL